jgi:hypothetical protein
MSVVRGGRWIALALSLAGCEWTGGTLAPPDAGAFADAGAGAGPGADAGARADSGTGTGADSGTDSGSDPSSDAGADAPVEADAGNGWVPSMLAVGYGGLRVISRDNGVSWKDDQEIESAGGDDNDLLRGVAYGNGAWVVTGWRFFTSADGALSWSEHSAPAGCGLMEGVAFGAGTFVGTCGTDAYLSPDGVQWTHAGSVGDTGGHTYVFFVSGLFYSSGDSGNSYSSPDGMQWTALANMKQVAYCESQIQTRTQCPGFWNDGMYLGTQWESMITRSTDGMNFTTVYDNRNLSPGNNAPYTPYAFALGYSPP